MSPAERKKRYGPYWSPWCEYTTASMQRHGLSNGDVARALGIPIPTVQSYMTGKVRPPLTLLTQWAKLMRLQVEEKVQFTRLAFFAHSEPEIVRWLLDSEKMAADLRAKWVAAEAACRRVELDLAEARAQAAGDV